MAVVENRATENGDILIVKTDVPILGVITLISFIDQTSNETGTRFFTKTFRYSLDGITWSAFLPLTIGNVSQIDVGLLDTLSVEYRYQRAGSDTTGQLEFNHVELEGEFGDLPPTPVFDGSLFPPYIDFNSTCTIGWSIAVLEKLYKKGVIPSYVTRDETGNNLDDKDFIDFWRTITHFFALYVCLARFFRSFYTDFNTLLEYLRERGLIVYDTVLQQDLLFLMTSYYDEIRQRGTVQIFEKKSDDKQVDGEYLRLLAYHDKDEFLFNVNKNEHIGLNIGNSSPLWRGLRGRENVNKFYTDEISTIDTPFFDNSTYIGVFTDTSINKDVLLIENVPVGQVSGLGVNNNIDSYITINPHLSYEIIFDVKQTNSPGGNLSLGCYSFDTNGAPISLLNVNTLAPQTFFFERGKLNTETYQSIKCIIYSYDYFFPFTSTISYKKGYIVRLGSNFFKAKRYVPIGHTTSETTYWQPLTLDEVKYALKPSNYLGDNLRFNNNINYIVPIVKLDNTLSGVGGSYPRAWFRLEAIFAMRTFNISVPGYGPLMNPYLTVSTNVINEMLAMVAQINSFQSDYLAIYNASQARIDIFALDGLTTWTLLVSNTPLAMVQYTLDTTFDTFDTIPSNSGDGEVYIESVQITPLFTEYSKGMLQSFNFCESFNVLNSQNNTFDQVLDISKRYLLPYNTLFKENFLKVPGFAISSGYSSGGPEDTDRVIV